MSDFRTSCGFITLIEKSLSQEQLYRLVEIAFETQDNRIRDAALKLFDRETDPPVAFVDKAA